MQTEALPPWYAPASASAGPIFPTALDEGARSPVPSILIIINYFGAWPEWFPIFLESCRANRTVHWLFHTDCAIPAETPPNVTFSSISLARYYEQVSDSLGISFKPEEPYKICDVRPAYGVIYKNEIQSFDYFGYGDLDVIYGNIRRFYTPDVLTHTLISAHGSIVSGHLTLLRNEEWVRNAFRLIPKWKKHLEDPRLLPWTQRLNEFGLTEVFGRRQLFFHGKRMNHAMLARLDALLYRAVHPRRSVCAAGAYFKEQFTTPLTPNDWWDGRPDHPEVWYWKDGAITNERDGDRQFLYLHFMNFKNARYLHPRYGSKAPWAGLPKLLHFEPRDLKGGTVRIDRHGFHLVSS